MERCDGERYSWGTWWKDHPELGGVTCVGMGRELSTTVSLMDGMRTQSTS
jgi:hypothetical protein